MPLTPKAQNEKYLNILSDGALHMTVPEGTPGAITREYETSTGDKGSKTELVFGDITGLITGISFFEGQYGKLLHVSIKDSEDSYVLSVGTATPYGEDLMKKLPNIDQNKEVTLSPYSFEDDKGKKRRGVTVTQDGQKLTNFYYDAEKKKTLHKFPELKIKKKMSKDDWKIHFMTIRIWLEEDLVERLGLEDKEIDAEKVFEDLTTKK